MSRGQRPEIRGHLEVTGLSVGYHGAPALRGVTFSVDPGQIVGVLGPNGAGKSTLLKALVGLVAPDAGQVRVDGLGVRAALRGIAYLPQRSEVDWDYPAVVSDLVAMGRYPHIGRRLRRRDRERVGLALERMGLSALAGRQIGRLSGGQRQRALLARALAQQARVILLDEPFAGIDALTENVVRQTLTELSHDGATLLVVDHDLSRATSLYDRLLLLSRRMVAYGPPDHALAADRLVEAYGATPSGWQGPA